MIIGVPSLMFALAAHDQRICGAFNVATSQFIYMNAAFEKFFQINPAIVSIAEILDMIHPDDRVYLGENYRAMESGVFKNNLEFRILLPNKKEHTLRLSMFFDEGQSGERVLIGYLDNISDAKANSNKLNEYANKKNSILNILSHELAGPLNSIDSLTTLLDNETKYLENKEIGQWIALMRETSRNGINLIQEFIQQEFIESAGVALIKKRTELVVIFRNAILKYQQLNVQSAKFFSYETNANTIYAEIDESKFFQAINNLISNAIKFTPDGGTITLGIEERAQNLLITVADNGIGIPEKYHATLFDKFSEARRKGLKGEPSVGLGMSIIKNIIGWHEGKIWFESEENKGTTFYIEMAKSS
ncbi:MAG: sensor histidine kinase [Janthinobacterium lividum]